MIEPMRQFPDAMPWSPEGALQPSQGLPAPDTHQPMVAPLRPDLPLYSLLALFYAGIAFVGHDGSAVRPETACVHLLMLLGAAVTFFGLWDFLALLGLRHLLRRDGATLWHKYGRHHTFRRRLDSSRFERDAELAGGVVTAVLRRFVALGRPAGDFVARHLHELLESARIGSATLTGAVTLAPLLGLLGTLVGLRAALDSSTGFEGLGRDLGPALTSAVLGAAIAVLAFVFSRALSGPVAADCHRLLAPVAEAARAGPIKDSAVSLASFAEAAVDKRILPWVRSPWSAELNRYRNASAITAWLLTAALIVVVGGWQ